MADQRLAILLHDTVSYTRLLPNAEIMRCVNQPWATASVTSVSNILALSDCDKLGQIAIPFIEINNDQCLMWLSSLIYLPSYYYVNTFLSLLSHQPEFH